MLLKCVTSVSSIMRLKLFKSAKIAASPTVSSNGSTTNQSLAENRHNDIASSAIFQVHKECFAPPAPDLDGGGAWGPGVVGGPMCGSDIGSSGKGWPMKSLVFPRIINICDVTFVNSSVTKLYDAT